MAKKIKVHFYKLEIAENSGVSFEKILNQVASLPREDRYQSTVFYPVYLYDVSLTSQGIWEGELIRHRMEELPVIGNRKCEIKDMILSDDEGIGEQTAFIYHPSTSILALQAGQYTISASGFAKYFELFDPRISKGLKLLPVFQLDAMVRFTNMVNVYELDVSIAGVGNMSSDGKTEYGINEVLDLNEAFSSPNISFKLTGNVKQKKPLNFQRIFDFANSLIVNNKNHLNKIKIKGSNDNSDDVYSIDLLKDRMVEEVYITTSAKKRNIPYPERQLALREAWNQRFDELSLRYSSKS